MHLGTDFLHFNWVIIIFVIMIVFLGIREIVCWYFKFTHISDLLEKIEENTRKKNKNDTVQDDNEGVIEKIIHP